METKPLTFSIPAYIATNPSTGICNVYDHLPQRLDNGDYAGNIVLTLGVKGTGEIPDRINYWSLAKFPIPEPLTKPIRITLTLDLSDQAHPITAADAHTSDMAVNREGRFMADHDSSVFTKDDLDFIFEENPIKKFP